MSTHPSDRTQVRADVSCHWWILMIMALTAAALSACGSSHSGDTSAAKVNRNLPVRTTAPITKPITDYPAWAGVKGGAANSAKPPITIGWINTQGGPTISFPAATVAAQAAIKYVNAKLGGVDGRPIRLETCFIVQSEEEGQACGQQMLNDPHVDSVLFGLVATGAQSIFSTIAGAKPIFIGSPADPSATTAKNTYSLSGTENAVFGPWATFAVGNLKAKRVAVVYPAGPAALSGAAAIKNGLRKAGATVTSVGFDPNANDLLGPLTAAGAQSADAIVPVADGPNCIKIAKALQQIGSHVPVISVPNCLDPAVAKALGDLPKWYYGIGATLSGDATAPDIQAYRKASGPYGLSVGQSLDPFAQLAWGQVLLVAKLMDQIGVNKVSPATLSKAMLNYHGSYPMGPPSLHCGAAPPSQPTSCNDEAQFYAYEGKGQFKLAAAWLQGPK